MLSGSEILLVFVYSNSAMEKEFVKSTNTVIVINLIYLLRLMLVINVILHIIYYCAVSNTQVVFGNVESCLNRKSFVSFAFSWTFLIFLESLLTFELKKN